MSFFLNTNWPGIGTAIFKLGASSLWLALSFRFGFRCRHEDGGTLDSRPGSTLEAFMVFPVVSTIPAYLLFEGQSDYAFALVVLSCAAMVLGYRRARKHKKP